MKKKKVFFDELVLKYRVLITTPDMPKNLPQSRSIAMP
jgi:hypothetical protein